MLEKLKRLQYGARVKLYQADQRQSLEVNGRKVQILRAGEGEPLVYLHSAVGENVWLPFHQGLAREFDVIAPAHSGLGSSIGGEDIDDWEDLSFHYLDLLDALELERVHLIGASYGGWAAAEFAVRHPERIGRLVLCNAFGVWLDHTPVIDLLKHLENPRSLREVMLARPESFVGELLFPDEGESDQLEGVVNAKSAIARLRSSPLLHDPKLYSRLRRIKSPTLVLWGASDKLLPSAYAHAYHSGIPNSLLHFIENCGHLPMFEQEARFVSAVTRFLKAG